VKQPPDAAPTAAAPTAAANTKGGSLVEAGSGSEAGRGGAQARGQVVALADAKQAGRFRVIIDSLQVTSPLSFLLSSPLLASPRLSCSSPLLLSSTPSSAAAIDRFQAAQAVHRVAAQVRGRGAAEEGR